MLRYPSLLPAEVTGPPKYSLDDEWARDVGALDCQLDGIAGPVLLQASLSE